MAALVNTGLLTGDTITPPVTQGYIEDLGFITEDEAADVFQQQTPENPVVLTSDLSNYLTRTDLPMTVTRDCLLYTSPSPRD